MGMQKYSHRMIPNRPRCTQGLLELPPSKFESARMADFKTMILHMDGQICLMNLSTGMGVIASAYQRVEFIYLVHVKIIFS